jgi:hypothetical protein
LRSLAESRGRDISELIDAAQQGRLTEALRGTAPVDGATVDHRATTARARARAFA